MKLIQDELERIVEKIKCELGFENTTFAYSTVAEFLQVLTNKKTPKSKYPFFFINSVNVKYDNNGLDSICTVDDIVIATYSDSKWSAKQRDLQSFKPILLPIYEKFIDKLKRDRHVELVKEGTITIHYFYGKTGLVGYESGEYPDHVDAIQLKNFQFRLTNNCKK